MTIILLTALLIGLLFAAMAIGVMFGRSPIKGSCGGMSALSGQGECALCGGDQGKCQEMARAADGIVGEAAEKVASGDRMLTAVHPVDTRQPR